jgi:acetyltransferase
MVDSLFKPKSIVIVGVSENPKKVGYLVTEKLIQQGFAGEIYLVNPKRDELFGKKLYKSVKDIQKPIDLAVLAVPADVAIGLLDELNECGIKNIVLYAAGFKEVNTEGAVKEQNLRMKAEKYGMTILGPNCIGYVNTINGANLTFLKHPAPRGNIGFLSQSGALGSLMVDYLVGHENFGFSYFISLGNKMMVDEVDVLKFLKDDPDTKVIGMYLEDVKQGEEFKKVLRETTAVKPVVVLKSGSTSEGSKAAGSHTGSMVGDDAVFTTVFEQCGAIRAGQFFEFMSILKMFSFERTPTSRDILVLSNAGGVGVLLTDELIKNKLSLVTIPEDLKNEIKQTIGSDKVTIHNPIDLLGDASAFHYRQAIATTLTQREVGAVVILLTPQANTEVEETAQAIIEAQKAFDNKPIYPVFMGEKSVGNSHERFEKAKIASFFTYDFVPKALAKIIRYKEYLQSSFRGGMSTGGQKGEPFAIPKKTLLNPIETNEVFEKAHIPSVPLYSADSKEKLRLILEKIGFPVVMKIASETITHKTDVKGVVTNVATEESAEAELARMMQIPDVHGVYVQQMKKGYEFIVGAKRDATFGTVVMIGIGGVTAEIMKSFVTFVYPFSKMEMNTKLVGTPLAKMLYGFRGSAPVSQDELYELLNNVGALMEMQQSIREIDLNPVLLDEGKLHIVDGRVLLSIPHQGV